MKWQKQIAEFVKDKIEEMFKWQGITVKETRTVVIEGTNTVYEEAEYIIDRSVPHRVLDGVPTALGHIQAMFSITCGEVLHGYTINQEVGGITPGFSFKISFKKPEVLERIPDSKIPIEVFKKMAQSKVPQEVINAYREQQQKI